MKMQITGFRRKFLPAGRQARIHEFTNSRLIQHNLIGLLTNMIQFYTVEPLWGFLVKIGYIFPGLHLRLIRGYSYYAPTGHAFDVRNQWHK